MPISNEHRRKGYNTWQAMHKRIAKPHREVYKNIDIDPRWFSFEVFNTDMGDKPEGYTLDRVDNTKGYWPDNCRWATPAEQQNNRSVNYTLTADGITDTPQGWAERLGIKRALIYSRRHKGWSDTEVLYGKGC